MPWVDRLPCLACRRFNAFSKETYKLASRGSSFSWGTLPPCKQVLSRAEKYMILEIWLQRAQWNLSHFASERRLSAFYGQRNYSASGLCCKGHEFQPFGSISPRPGDMLLTTCHTQISFLSQNRFSTVIIYAIVVSPN